MTDEITYEWTNNIIFTPGQTPLGVYDIDPIYRQDAIRVAKYCAFSLGFPMVNIELHPFQMFTFFETAIDKYTSLINESNIVNNMSAVIGTDKNINLTSKYIAGKNFNDIFTHSDAYGTEFGSGGNVTFKKFKVETITGQQDYDLKELIEMNVENGEGELINVAMDINIESFLEQLSLKTTTEQNIKLNVDTDEILINIEFDKINSSINIDDIVLMYEYDNLLLEFIEVIPNENFSITEIVNVNGKLMIQFGSNHNDMINNICQVKFKLNQTNNETIILNDTLITTNIILSQCIINNNNVIYDNAEFDAITSTIVNLQSSSYIYKQIEEKQNLISVNDIYDTIDNSNIFTTININNLIVEADGIVQIEFNVFSDSDYLMFKSFNQSDSFLTENVDMSISQLTPSIMKFTFNVKNIDEIDTITNYITGIGNLLNINFKSKSEAIDNLEISITDIKLTKLIITELDEDNDGVPNISDTDDDNDGVLDVDDVDVFENYSREFEYVTLPNINANVILHETTTENTEVIKGNKIEIKNVFHVSPSEGIKAYMSGSSGLYNHYALDSVEQLGGGYTSGMIKQYMTPLHSTIMASQNYEMMSNLYRSNYSWNIRNNVLEVLPIPTSNGAIWIEYILSKDKINNIIHNDDVISDASNIKYEAFEYSNINQPGRTWIKQYCLALVKMGLGEIRSKYGDIPIPDSSISLNGSDLKSEGQQEAEKLIESLNETLEKLTPRNRMEAQKEIGENINSQLENLPFPILIG